MSNCMVCVCNELNTIITEDNYNSIVLNMFINFFNG